MNRSSGQRLVLPLPPVEMRELVGDPGLETFDHPAGEPVFPTVTTEQYASVFDFGCGCGRVARQLALAAAPMPGKYLGIDLHREMIDWCNENLAPRLRNFSFVHHDVFNPGFNPDPSLPRVAPFPLEDHSVTLLVAWSVFTHLLQTQAEYYMDEVARVLAPMGVMIATFFMFDKAYFPMMQEFQNALYINEDDPTNAVIFDRHWLVESLESRGLRIRSADPPIIRGFQWRVEVVPGRDSIPLQDDVAPFGRMPPPVRQPDRPA
jgi:SAM-dependent methyltransferase